MKTIKKDIKKLKLKISQVLLTPLELERVMESLKYKSYPYLRILWKLRKQEMMWEEMNFLQNRQKHLEELRNIRLNSQGNQILMEDVVNADNLNKLRLIKKVCIPKIVLDHEKRVKKNKK